ncbi:MULTISPECIES: DUF5667 domain-containing protein [unclassified Crossiella]|uniref:DUF5667 domain-containing protein n=1 Tax=unclassified Crossiella TaxID=2620835 RepID=UPI001FFFE840|nr:MULTISPECIES: DUF5667 domain-containing protein [unclassified Crossiella]MCK2236717.1 DUF5667 domain-containing protein [Crossiella sp. S99.2]MCK2250385.1 DUF5667 domain-containing protein [Crossiella sp. S99.1]
MSTDEPPSGPSEGPAQFARVLPALAAYEQHLNPDAAARDRMRARLMADFPAAVREAQSRSEPTARRRRFAVALAACVALIASVTGMSVLLSRDAVPGDALYAVKRSAESAELGLIFREHPRAFKHLEFADSRVTELGALLDRPGAPVADFARALADFESDAAAGSRLLTELGADTDDQLFAALADWTTREISRLRTASVALPPAARQRLEVTMALLERIRQRASELRQRAGCLTITSGAADDIGALPATERCVPVPAREVSPLPSTGASGRAVVSSPTSTPAVADTPARTPSRHTPAPPPIPLPQPSLPQVSTPPPVEVPAPPTGLLPGLLDLLKLPFGLLGPNR